MEASALTAGSHGVDFVNYNIEGVDLSDCKRQSRAIMQQKVDLFYSQEASLADMSIEAII